jgi:hypothetical protein
MIVQIEVLTEMIVQIEVIVQGNIFLLIFTATAYHYSQATMLNTFFK